MDLRNALMQTSKTRPKRGWKGVLTSIVIHGTLVGVVVLLSMTAADKVTAEDKAIPVYVSQGAAPPPPPPPPPAASSSAPTPSTPKVVKVEPVQVPRDSFVAPTEIPDDPIPVIAQTPVVSAPTTEAPSSGAVTGGVPGGVAGGITGGVLGGVQGGTLGGEVGGEIGGVLGGVKGGVVGATVGGTPGGTGTTGIAPGPLRVGGNVKAPKTTTRVEPVYTEPARKARVTGVVVVEAIIDKRGNVDRVTVLRGLPMGLTESAVAAVKRWKFRPGTQNGQPVDVIFNLTVTFTLGGPGEKIARPERSTPKVVKQEPSPAPEPVVEPEPAAPTPEPEPPPAAEPLPAPPGA